MDRVPLTPLFAGSLFKATKQLPNIGHAVFVTMFTLPRRARRNSLEISYEAGLYLSNLQQTNIAFVGGFVRHRRNVHGRGKIHLSELRAGEIDQSGQGYFPDVLHLGW